MFLQKALTKSINESYFRNYQETKFKQIKGNETAEELRALVVIAAVDFEEEFEDMVLDLYNLVKKNNCNPNSMLTISLLQKQKLAENRVQRQVEDKLSPEAKQFVDIITSEFEEDTWIVGGFVRDAIAGRDSNDVDFCTSIPYDKLQEVFRKNLWETKDTGKQFLVLNVIHPFTKENFEVAALRKDKDNEGAEVGTIEEDAQRRDFVNSCIYFSLKTQSLIDPSGDAITDCQSNTLQFMGKAKDRIKEDPLRVFRAYKFIQRGWEPTPKTLRAVRENFEFAMKNVSSTRVMNEVEKMVGL